MTSKPMSDGGKGSVRRNEDTEAYRNNFDNIFRKDKKEEPEMIDYEDDGEEEYEICPACSGSGEGMHESQTCYKCKGRGEISTSEEEDDDSDY